MTMEDNINALDDAFRKGREIIAAAEARATKLRDAAALIQDFCRDQGTCNNCPYFEQYAPSGYGCKMDGEPSNWHLGRSAEQ